MARRFCSRRDLLRFGCAAPLLGLNLSGLLRARAAMAGNPPAKIRSCIVVFYYGGPSHLDTYDMKPNAPLEIRGEFNSIASSVPGLRVCEHLPRMSRIMHKVALIRSMHHENRLHDSASTEALTGRPSLNGDREEFAPIRQFFPSYGAALSYLRAGEDRVVPHAALPWVFHNVVDVPCQGAGFLGSAFDPLQIFVDVAQRAYRAGSLDLPADWQLPRLARRSELLSDLNRQSSAWRGEEAARQMVRFRDKALELLACEAIREALDLRREPTAVRERYGYDQPPRTTGEGGGGGNGAELGAGRELRGQNLLVARRLVEAGVPFVNVYDFRQQGQNWDAHFKVFSQHKNYLLPLADQSLAALIEDLDERGLLDSTLVVAMGEFGRTPRINGDGGRDHWPDCYTVLLAGGGVQGGYVHGASDQHGAYPALDPVTPADLAATIFWRFGIDPRTEIHDLAGRPFRVAEGVPIRGLFRDG